MKRLAATALALVMLTAPAEADPKLEFFVDISGATGVPLTFEGFKGSRTLLKAEFSTTGRPVQLGIPWSTFEKMDKYCVTVDMENGHFRDTSGAAFSGTCQSVSPPPPDLPDTAVIRSVYEAQLYQ